MLYIRISHTLDMKFFIFNRNEYKMKFLKGNDPATMNTLMTSLLKQKGPDQHYTFVGSNDLRPYNISAYFILQVYLK